MIAEYAGILRSYGITEIMGDNYGAGLTADEWARNGSKFKKCDNNTAENFLCALPLLTSKRAHLADNATLRTQLSGLERRVVAGHETVGHAQVASAHDDVAAAVAGVVGMLLKAPFFVPPGFVADLTARLHRGPGERAEAQRHQMQQRRLYGF